MKFRKLKVESFGSVREAVVDFGPGLNIFFGPNDLGKSTLAEAIRLALLLPFGSSYSEQFVPWTGARGPVVELQFELSRTDIWSVRKEFGKGGSALLRWSKNGRDFEDVEKARGVERKLRELLQWGIPEPGGAGAAKGLPSSFLATALLSTQANVTEVFATDLARDPNNTGKERIAAALQAVAQDPLFLAILKETQARRDMAYTDKGSPKTGKDSVLRRASQKVTERRKEMEELKKLVDESSGVELQLEIKRQECDRQDEKVSELSKALREAQELERIHDQRQQARSELTAAQAEVERIVQLGTTVERLVGDAQARAERVNDIQVQLDEAKLQVEAAEAALRQAEENQRQSGADASAAATLARQDAELRKAAAERRQSQAQAVLESAESAERLLRDAEQARLELTQQEQVTQDCQLRLTEAEGYCENARGELNRVQRLEQGLHVICAQAEADRANQSVAKQRMLVNQKGVEVARLAGLEVQRATYKLPPVGRLPEMRKLETERATARGALQVGLGVTILPHRPLALRALNDGQNLEDLTLSSPFRLEAESLVELDIPEVAQIKVEGGSKEAQERAAALEKRWQDEAVVHLQAAGVKDLEALSSYVEEARAIDQQIADANREISRLDGELQSLQEVELVLQRAEAKLVEARFCGVSLAPEELQQLGADPAAAIDRLRSTASKALEDWREKLARAVNEKLVADERLSTKRQQWQGLVQQCDAALAPFLPSLTEAVQAAQAQLAEAVQMRQQAESDLGQLQEEAEATAQKMAVALATAQALYQQAKDLLADTQTRSEQAKSDRDLLQGELSHARKILEAEDLSKAQAFARQAATDLEALPVPGRAIRQGEVEALAQDLESAKTTLESIRHEILEAQGALKQVGGDIARERLLEVEEACRLAEQQEADTEANYAAWRLLLDTLKEADAAQASNLGQALAPAIADNFAKLTQQRYQGLNLDAQLATRGIQVHSADRDINRVSVGTREQLSTLYRLCLAEYLGTTLVLDDQLVQSDAMRMDWFRALLAEKARTIQIVVFTCRPTDYIDVSDLPTSDEPMHKDSDENFVRAVDLERAIKRS